MKDIKFLLSCMLSAILFCPNLYAEITALKTDSALANAVSKFIESSNEQREAAKLKVFEVLDNGHDANVLVITRPGEELGEGKIRNRFVPTALAAVIQMNTNSPESIQAKNDMIKKLIARGANVNTKGHLTDYFGVEFEGSSAARACFFYKDVNLESYNDILDSGKFDPTSAMEILLVESEAFDFSDAQIEFLKVLLSKGARPNAKTQEGFTIQDYVIGREKFIREAGYDEDKGIVKVDVGGFDEGYVASARPKTWKILRLLMELYSKN